MSHRRAGAPANKAATTIPRVERDILPGRAFPSNTSGNGNSDHASNASFTSTSADVSRQRDQARDIARADGRASHGVASKRPGLSLNATVRRVQESWEATRASKDKSSPGDTASRNVYAEMQRMKSLNRSSAANSRLGKRLSSGAYEEVRERKRRAIADGRHASGRQVSPTTVSSGSDEEASRRRSAPTAGRVNRTSPDKPRPRSQVLRAVRSAPNKHLSPALRGAESRGSGSQILEKSASGRHYKAFVDDEGKMIPTGGALIPDGYEKYDDDMTPFICPIRSCRRLFRNMIALGAHFGAGHRHLNLNDNGDGTLSTVGQFQAVSGQITARIVSRKPLDPSEPPMATPKPPDYAKPLATVSGDSPPAGTKASTTAASGRTPRAVPSPVNPLPRRSPSSSSPAPASPADLGTKVMPYLRTVLPEDFNFGLFTLCKEGPLLLQLSVKRHATTEWIKRITTLKTHSPQCLTALLVFLTGTAVGDPCPTCVTSDAGDECIVPGPSFPGSAAEKFAGSCATCYYRCNRWHQKNHCLLCTNGDSTPKASSRASSFVDEAMASGLAGDEMEDGADDEAVEDRVSPTEQPDLTNVTPEPHTRQEPFPLRLPAPEPHNTLPTRDKQGASTSGSLLNQGNLISADVVEMEDWEIAPGTIRNTSDEPDNIAFSNAYLFSNNAVPVVPGVGFNVITLKPGGSHKFPAQESLRLCSLATGKLSVKVTQEGGDAGFRIGPNGMFKVLPGSVVSVRNRLYIDAVLHVTTVEV